MEKRLLESTPYEGLKNGTHIEAEVYYTKGGANFFSGDVTPRGYYLSVTPVTRRGDGMVSFSVFTGVAELLLPANRFSSKQFEQAIELGRQEAPALIEHVLQKERAA